MGICYCVGSSPEKCSIAPKAGDLVIAADGGAAKVSSYDLALGDFDSLGFVPKGENVLSFPSRKDDTDMLLALREGLKRGYRRFVLTCALGGRIDHALANIQCLAYLMNHKARGIIRGESETLFLLKDGEARFRKERTGRVSVLAWAGEARGVTIKGLSYETEEVTLSDDRPIGISNEFIGKEAEIRVQSGTLLIIVEGLCDRGDIDLQSESGL